MQLIPVLDVQAGQVVRAVRGQRATYRAVQSRLAPGCDPVVIGAALLAAAQHSQPAAAGDIPLYIADLDALQGRARQTALLQDLMQRWPTQTFWVDAGFVHPAEARDWRTALGPEHRRVIPVLGSESLGEPAALLALRDTLPDAVLSLDRRAGQWLDAAGCWQRPEAWPSRVIVMTLERVGSGEGPDLDTLRQAQAVAPRVRLIGSGGLRDASDGRAAAAAGAAAWLVASAWHDGGLPAGPICQGEAAGGGLGRSAPPAPSVGGFH